MNEPKYIIVHTVAKKGVTTLQEIDQWHKQRGFNSFGYHYYIRKDGQLENGRPEHEQGAHCLDMGMNSKSIGICFEGHGNYEPWTTEQIQTWQVVANHLMQKYSIPITNILGHRETGAKKDCPGKLIDMTKVRNELEAYVLNSNNLAVNSVNSVTFNP
jgi:N-acetylmuramoyl-L-alanine amidase